MNEGEAVEEEEEIEFLDLVMDGAQQVVEASQMRLLDQIGPADADVEPPMLELVEDSSDDEDDDEEPEGEADECVECVMLSVARFRLPSLFMSVCRCPRYATIPN